MSKTSGWKENQFKPSFSKVKTIMSKLIFKDSVVFISAVMMGFAIFSTPALANPVGGVVVGGNASIHQVPNSTVINQSSQKAIINWQSFNIGTSESTHFQQPSGGIALNRINPSQGASQIYGRLTATGQIILVNPAGLHFGPSAYVNVGGLIATTADISNQNFMSGNYSFSSVPGYSGSVINEGKIIVAEHGLAALVAPEVVNKGLIEANVGNVVLASGNAFTISFAGNDLISFAITEPASGSKTGVTNTGAITANGGKVLVTAKTAQGVLDNVINMEGVVEAKSVGVKNGEIILMGGDQGVVRVAGKVNVSGQQANAKGGKVKITGKRVLVDSDAVIDASGDIGGGEILIGGDYLGKGPLPNASATVIMPNARVKADAISHGDGGKVIAWSDDMTKFYGDISARGGANGGNGGFIETSSKNYLEAMGNVDASAPLGKSGSWLLDPTNVTISLVDLNISTSGGNPDIFNVTASPATINAATIVAALNLGTSVTVLTDGFDAGQAGSITVSSPIAKILGGDATLTLNAGTAAGAAVTINSAISSIIGALNVVIIGDSLTLNSAVTTNGGSFTSTTQNATTLANSINTGAGTVTINANVDGTGTNNFLMNAGSSITTTNTSANAVAINVNAAAGGTGTATLRGITTGNGGGINVATNTGGNTTGGNIVFAGASPLDTGTGTVTLTTSQTAGRAIGTSANPVLMIGNNLNATTGTGDIFVTNTGTGALDLGTINSTDAFTLVSTSSAGITDSGTLTAAGITTITAGATQDITLDSATNNFGTVTINSGRNTTLVDTNALVLGASTISGSYNVTAGGSITQSGALNVTGTPTFTLTTATTDVSLASQANNFSTTPVITDNGNVRDLLLRNTNAGAVAPIMPSGMRNLTLTFNNAPSLVLPAVTLTGSLTATITGPITQSGALVVPTTATLTAGAANDITLNNANNNFGTVAIPSANNVVLSDLNALILGTITASGTLDVTTGGALTDSGTLTIPGLATLDSGTGNNITLNSAGNNFSSVKVLNANNVTLVDTNAIVLDGINAAGGLTLTTNGAVTQTDVITAPGTTSITAGAANNITLNNPANNFGTFTTVSGNNVSVQDATGIILGTSGISGTLDVVAGGNISQSGILTITGIPTFTLTSALTDILLSTSANAFSSTPVFTNNGNIRDISLRNTLASAVVPSLPASFRNLTLTFNAAAMTLPALNLTGTLTATASGLISQAGSLIVSGVTTLAAGAANNITLTNASNDFSTVAVTNGNDVSLTDINALILGTATVSGTYNILTGGAITQSGTQTITGLTTLNSSGNNITLATAANNFSTITASGNNISLRDANALILDNIIALGTLTLQASGAGGSLTQAGGSTISATGTTTLIGGTANDISLTNAGNDFSTVGITSGLNVGLTDVNAIALAASTVSGTLGVTAGGSISQSGALTVTGTPTFTVSAANSDILLSTSANNFSATPVITNNGNVRDLGIRNTNAAAVVPTLPTGMRNLTLIFNAAGMDLPAVTLTGDLTATATSAITQSGALIGSTMTAKTLNNAGAAISLSNVNNEFSTIDLRARNAGDTANAAGAITYHDLSAFDINLIGTTSTINLTGGGAITQTGTISGTTMTAKTLNNSGASIDLSNSANALTAISMQSRNAADTANAAGALTYRDASGLDIVSIGTTSSANVIATALTQSGAIEADSLTAKTLNNAGGAITFNNVSNNVNSIDLRARNAADTANDTGVITYTDSSGFDVATIGTASTVTLNAGGAISDSGNITGTTLTTSSIGGSILDFGHNVTGFNATNAGSGNIDLVNTGTLSITGVNLTGGGDLAINNTGTSTITGTVDTATGDTSLISTGAVSDSTAGSISTQALSVLTLNDGGSDITFNNTGVHNVASIDMRSRNAANTQNTNGTITFSDIDGFDVAAANTTGTVTFTGGDTLTQSGSMTGSTLTATTLNNAGAAITFNDANNLFTNINLQSRNAANNADANGNINYSDADGINITGLRTLTNANVSALGAITDSGAVVADSLTTTSVGGTTLNSGVQISNLNLSNSDSGAVTLVNTAPLTITGFSQSGGGSVSLTNTGELSVANGVSINSSNAAIGITATDLDLNATGSINSGSATTTITQNTNGGSIGLGNAVGTMSISGSELQRITSNAFNVVADTDGQIMVDGITAAQSANISGTTTLTATAGTLGTISFENTASSFNALSGNADNGISVGAQISTLTGNLSLDADVNGNIAGNDALALNANLNSAGSMTLSAENGGIVLGASISLVGIGITINDGVSGAQSLNMNAGTGTARFNNPVSIASLEMSGNVIAMNAGSVTTTGDQTYTGSMDVGPNTTMTASNFTFNSDVFGNSDLTLQGQAGDNQFTFNDSVGLDNLMVMGSAGGNNMLTVKSGAYETWGITGANQGNLSGTEITGNFDFANIRNLTGGDQGNSFNFSDGSSVGGMIDGGNLASTNTLNYSAYSNPVKVVLGTPFFSGTTQNNSSSVITNFMNINDLVGSGDSILQMPSKSASLNFTGFNSGFVGDPINFTEFSHFITANASDAVVFFAHGVWNVATQQLTVNGLPVQMTGFNPANFVGNITFINNPIPPTPPVPPNPNGSVNDFIASKLMTQEVNPVASGNKNIVITDNTSYSMVAGALTFEGMKAIAKQATTGALGQEGISTQFGALNQLSPVTKGRVFEKSSNFFAKNVKAFIADVRTLSTQHVSLFDFALLLAGIGLLIIELRRLRAIRMAGDAVLQTKYNLPDISFKLRTALDDIIGFSEIIYNEEAGQISAKQKEFIGDIIIQSKDIMAELERFETKLAKNSLYLETPEASFKMRTALNNIMGFANLMHAGEVGEVSAQQKEFLDDIMSGSSEIFELITR